MKCIRSSVGLFTFVFALTLVMSGVNIAFAVPTVTLKVLNVPNEFGDIIVVRGNNVEVEFVITDPLQESSNEDIIRLVRIEDGAVATQMARGKELSGSRSLGTQKTSGNDVLGKLQVQYISRATKQVLTTSPQTVFLVDNQSTLELTERTATVEKDVIVAKEKAAAAEAAAAEAMSKAEALQARADLLEQQASELRARADETDNKYAAAKLDMQALKLEQEAAKLERQANALAAAEAKAAAAAADTKATDAKTKADAADIKATDAKTKAEALQARADLLEQQASELRARADETDNKYEAAKLDMQALKMEQEAAKLERQANALAAAEAKAAAAAADTKATDAKTKADAADIKATDAKTKADTALTASEDAKAKALSADAKADTALADTADLQNQINNLPASAQSCASGEYVTGIDANGNIVCAPLPSVSIPAMKLLAYYPFSGNVLDASGNNYNGTVGGTAAYGVGHDGTGQSFSFNGATYISTLLDIDVDVQPQLTMGAWVRPNVGTFYAQVMTHDDQGFDRSIVHYGSDWRAYDGGSGGSVHTGPIPATDNWQFVAVVYDQDRQTVMLYADGSTFTKANQLLGPSVNMFRMGNNQSNSAEFFQGLVDEVFVVSGALDINQLDQIRLNGIRSLFP